MKKIIALLIVAVICAGIFVGCGSNPLANVEKAEEVITYLEKQGLPIVYKVQYTSKNDPNGTTYPYKSRANFSDSTIEKTYDKEQPESGAVELFATAEEAQKRAIALKEYQGGNPLAYMILKDKILLRMNTGASKETVEKYATALGTTIYSEPNEYSKMLRAASIENGVFAVSPQDFAKIINQYVQDEAPINNMSKTSATNKDFYTYNIDAYSIIRFVTDETRKNTQFILLEYDYISDHSNTAKIGSYFPWIAMASDKKMTADLGTQIIHDLNMLNMKQIGSHLSVHNGVSYFLTADTNKITILITPESNVKGTNDSVTSTPSTSSAPDSNSSEPPKSSSSSAPSKKPSTPSKAETPQTSPPSTTTVGQANALKRAKSYLNSSAFSYTGLIKQLEYEKFSNKDAVYAADNCGANWNGQSLKKAKSYLRSTAFSYSGLVKQLKYEGFTPSQASYGADNCGANWNEQAAKKAKSYLNSMSFSRDGLIKQLKYEGFTHAQAVYGVDQTGL